MSITASQVKELRELTGAGMMDAKKALVEADGDMKKAAEVLRQRGIATAEKKSGRTAAEGLVQAEISADGKTGVLVEVNCETDFVAKGDAFTGFADSVAKFILEKSPANTDALLALPAPGGSGSMKDHVTEQIAQIKENISIRRFVRYEIAGAGQLKSYIHTGGKIGVLVELVAGKDETVKSDEFQQLVKDLSMQIASSAPEFPTRDEVSKEVIEEETRVEMGKEDIQSKPPEIREKIVSGRVDKLVAQKVLYEQPFIKDPSKTVSELVQETASKLGDTLKVSRFTRYLLGEGIEKEEKSFAEEVMAAQAQ
ncbi:MAG: translation elongation factor Ts [Vampirovibrio sp.]|nr:translation elongation factor Ts [Vampirovibrio sp.]